MTLLDQNTIFSTVDVLGTTQISIRAKDVGVLG